MSETDPERLRAALVAVQTPDVNDQAFAASVAELGRLARTLGIEVVATVTQRRATLHPGSVLGRGKLAELQVLAGFTGGEEDETGDEGGGEAAALHEVEVGGLEGGPITAVLVDHEIYPVAGAQPGDGHRRRGDGPDSGDPGDLSSPRPLARGEGAGRDRAAVVPGAPAARAGAPEGRATASAAASAARARANRAWSWIAGRSAIASPS